MLVPEMLLPEPLEPLEPLVAPESDMVFVTECERA